MNKVPKNIQIENSSLSNAPITNQRLSIKILENPSIENSAVSDAKRKLFTENIEP